jgi:CBS domain-containing protein
MRVSEVMTRNVKVAAPDASVTDVARLMRDFEVGVVPVCDGERLLGMVTDRDIVVRALAEGRAADTAVRELMTDHVDWCREDADVAEVADKMANMQVRRMPVVDAAHRLVGIVSLGDLALEADPELTGDLVADVSTPGGEHAS